ncbi:MAG TPA: hypothetical protein VNH18_35655 [Bryobacteraceae bacterium]|nr:hypothetical protein [Bryobacteraceae bacterium]HXJ44679.1 hypothetical protein [Bryobacteraceae bacterium]
MQPCAAQQAIFCTEPISIIHDTDEGPVHLFVLPSKAGWRAFHWSPREAGTWTFSTLQEANEHLLRFFGNLYSGHRCSLACGPVDGIDAHKSDDLWGMIRE